MGATRCGRGVLYWVEAWADEAWHGRGRRAGAYGAVEHGRSAAGGRGGGQMEKMAFGPKEKEEKLQIQK